eukprot:COSAG01_NODE_723_length_14060_cov_132.571807_7_plen_60_part_00
MAWSDGEMGKRFGNVDWELEKALSTWRGGRDALVLTQHHHYGPELTAPRPPCLPPAAGD